MATWKYCKFALFSCFLTAMMACGPGFETHKINSHSFSTYDNPPSTGAFGEVKTPEGEEDVRQYTPIGPRTNFDRLRTERGANNNPEFAEKISRVNVARKYDNVFQRFEYDISITVKGLNEPLNFKYHRIEISVTQWKEVVATKVGSDGHQYRLDSRCEKTECTTMAMTLKKFTTDNKKLAEASFLYRNVRTHIRGQAWSKNSDHQDPRVRKVLEDLTKGNPTANIESVSILDGPSYSEIQVRREEDSLPEGDKSTPTTKPLLTIRTPNVMTNDSSVVVDRIDVDDEEKQKGVVAKGALAGINPTSGSMAFDVELNVQQDPQNADAPNNDGSTDEGTKTPPSGAVTGGTTEPPVKLRIVLPVPREKVEDQITPGKPDGDNAGDQSPDNSNPSQKIPPQRPKPVDTTQVQPVEYNAIEAYVSPLIPLHTAKDKEIPSTMDITQKLEAYREYSEVKRFIRVFQGEETYFECCKKYKIITKSNGKKVKRCVDRNESYMDNKNKDDGLEARHFSKWIPQKFLRNMKVFSEVFSRAANLVDAPPQATYFMALEDNAYTDMSAKSITADRRSDASGPIQMLTDTARGVLTEFDHLLSPLNLNLQVNYTTKTERDQFAKGLDRRWKILRKLKKDNIDYSKLARELVQEDARGYFVTANLLAALYTKDLMESKWSDPALAPISYRLGPLHMAKYTVCASKKTVEERNQCYENTSAKDAFSERHEGYETTLAEVTDLNMGSCEGLQYTFAYLAMQFIGSSPEVYGFKDLGEPEYKLEDIKDKLLPPGVPPEPFGLEKLLPTPK